MGLVTLPNLYCQISDLVDYLSSEGVELRLDDHNQATNQQVIVTSQYSGGTSLTIAAIETAPLPNGCVLNFDGGGLPSVVQVVLTAVGQVGATSLSILPVTSQIPPNAFAYDNGVNIVANARALKACMYATARVKRYCCSRYNDSDLATSWSVNEWATYIAGRWLCKRRQQGVPQSVEEDFKEAMDELKLVQAAKLQIEDIATRTASWPAWSNMSIDLTYDIHKARVEQSLSEQTPTQYSQYIDWWDAQNYEW